jgi:nicotinate-nucleotide adenylyltransferase
VRRLGLLGGTFDPPHYGHLVAAQEVAWRLALDRVLFLPARQNPLKPDEASSSGEDRCAMVERAIDGNPVFEVSRLDLDRPPPSYTADLLKVLASPDCELFFVVGADILPELPRWRDPEQIVRLARLAVVTRPGSPAADLSQLERLSPGGGSRATLVEIPGLAIASRDLRQRVRTGEPIRYLTPPDVERYILERGLYRG